MLIDLSGGHVKWVEIAYRGKLVVRVEHTHESRSAVGCDEFIDYKNLVPVPFIPIDQMEMTGREPGEPDEWLPWQDYELVCRFKAGRLIQQHFLCQSWADFHPGHLHPFRITVHTTNPEVSTVFVSASGSPHADTVAVVGIERP